MIVTTLTGRIVARALLRLSLAIVVILAVSQEVADAQPTGKVFRIGLLSSGSTTTPPIEGFRQGLRDLGWVEGQNIVVEYRITEGRVDQLSELAAELVGLKVDIIAAGPTPPAVAAKNATRTIPVVMLGAAQPVELGLIASLARPGGNVTGVSWSVNLEIIGKGLELLKEILPKIRLVAILWNPANPAQAIAVKEVKHAARTVGVELQLVEVREASDLDAAFASMAKKRAQAVLVVADALFVSSRTRLAALEAKYRMPSVHALKSNVEAGGLMSYGPDIVAVWRRAALFVDKILRGAKPADLPVEQPTKYQLVINLRTAKALGLTIPQPLLLRADEVIE
jgi:putative ABC transport system substrate-binding protein